MICISTCLIGQPPPPEGAIGLGDLLRIHVIPADPVNDMELARAQIVQPSFYLLRPDGHVGLCGVHLEACRRSLPSRSVCACAFEAKRILSAGYVSWADGAKGKRCADCPPHRADGARGRGRRGPCAAHIPLPLVGRG